jgi:hypothetical protein
VRPSVGPGTDQQEGGATKGACRRKSLPSPVAVFLTLALASWMAINKQALSTFPPSGSKHRPVCEFVEHYV